MLAEDSMVSRSVRLGFVVVNGVNTEPWKGSCAMAGGNNISWFPKDADTRSGKESARRWYTRMGSGYVIPLLDCW